MITANERFQEVWAVVETITQQELGEFAAQVSAENQLAPTDSDCSTEFLLQNIQIAILTLEARIKKRVEAIGNGPYDRVAVPKADVLDRVLRADSAAERNLGRAINRLERLQRRRKGEPVPTPVSVRLTR